MKIARVRIGNVTYRRDYREKKPPTMLSLETTENGKKGVALWELASWTFDPEKMLRLDTFVRRRPAKVLW